MTLKRRLQRLEQMSPAFYSDVSEIPTHVLEVMVRRAWREGNLNKKDKVIFQQLKELGLKL